MAIKKGIFQGCFPSNMSFEESLKESKKNGFSGIELLVEPSNDLPFDLIEQANDISDIAKSVGAEKAKTNSIHINSNYNDIINIKNIVNSYGLEIHSIVSLLMFMFPITSPSKKIRNTGIEIAEKLIDIAYNLGADTVLFIPGMVTPNISYDLVYSQSKLVIKDLLKKSSQLNITLAIENVWNRFLLSPLEMKEYIDEFKTEWIGVYFDVGNILNYGYPEQWIKILGKRIKKIHLKDFLLDIGNIHGFTYLFQGNVNWSAVMHALKEIKYDGYLTVEVPPYLSYPLETFKHNSEAIDILINELND
jgi:L-ribulose-5-phosphate 3-epimerase